MAAGARRSRAELAAGFAGWLSAREGREVTVEVTRPSSGLSSETVFVQPAGGEPLVIRLPPSGEALFPDYDLAGQQRVQAALVATDVPVAPPLALETDLSWVGAPFLVMPRIAGRTLTGIPPYSREGWLAEAPVEVQADVFDDMADLLARIHRLDLPALDLGALSGGGPTLSGMLDFWTGFLDWATDDPAAGAVYREGLEHLRATLPEPGPTCLLWGDPQLVNVVYDDAARPAAVLDWEMAALGPAEVDLGWFLALHEGVNETGGQVLPGDPGREAFVKRYEASLGREVRDLDWYELFAHVRSGAIVVRIGELMARSGMPHGWTAHVPQLRHVRRLVEAS